jgi:hypothetical protein
MTDTNGNWEIGVRGGAYQVEFENPGTNNALSNWELTTPVGGVYDVNIIGNNVGGLNFGVRPASAPGTPSANLIVRPGGVRARISPILIGSQTGIASIRIGNTGNALATGPVEVKLYASSIPGDEQSVQLKAGDVSIEGVQENMTIAPGGSRMIAFRFTIPRRPVTGQVRLGRGSRVAAGDARRRQHGRGRFPRATTRNGVHRPAPDT